MNLLSKYRLELFGLAAIGTVFTHYQYFVTGIPTFLAVILSYGGSGVYIFSLLSGMGLYYSLSRDGNEARLSAFYKKRAVRLLLPYILIVGIWYAIKYLIVAKDVGAFFLELSTLSFWLYHKGAWYVAMLIPVYLFFPFYYSWVEKNEQYRGIKSIVAALLNLILGLSLYQIAPEVFRHLRGVWGCLFFFVLGNYIAKSLRENCFNDIPLLIGSIVAVLLKRIVPAFRNYMPIYTITYALSGVIVAVVFSRLLQRLHLKVAGPTLRFLGKYSLEMYLSNLVWIQVFQFFEVKFPSDNYGITTYGLILLLGFITAVLFGMIIERLRFGLVKNT